MHWQACTLAHRCRLEAASTGLGKPVGKLFLHLGLVILRLGPRSRENTHTLGARHTLRCKSGGTRRCRLSIRQRRQCMTTLQSRSQCSRRLRLELCPHRRHRFGMVRFRCSRWPCRCRRHRCCNTLPGTSTWAPRQRLHCKCVNSRRYLRHTPTRLRHSSCPCNTFRCSHTSRLHQCSRNGHVHMGRQHTAGRWASEWHMLCPSCIESNPWTGSHRIQLPLGLPVC